MKVNAIDHICIAVKDLEASRRAYEETFGWEAHLEYIDENEKIKVVRYLVGGVALELMEDLDGTGPVAGFIKRRGEGLYLISYAVDNVETCLGELKDKGVPTIDKKPREIFGSSYAFIQPPSKLGGVLTEIIQGEFDLSKP